MVVKTPNSYKQMTIEDSLIGDPFSSIPLPNPCPYMLFAISENPCLTISPLAAALSSFPLIEERIILYASLAKRLIIINIIHNKIAIFRKKLIVLYMFPLFKYRQVNVIATIAHPALENVRIIQIIDNMNAKFIKGKDE